MKLLGDLQEAQKVFLLELDAILRLLCGSIAGFRFNKNDAKKDGQVMVYFLYTQEAKR